MKLTVSKSLFILKITYILLSLPSPTHTTFKEIATEILDFLCEGNPPK